MKRHRAREFRAFLDEVESAVPAEVVMDNASSHKTKLIQEVRAAALAQPLHPDIDGSSSAPC